MDNFQDDLSDDIIRPGEGHFNRRPEKCKPISPTIFLLHPESREQYWEVCNMGRFRDEIKPGGIYLLPQEFKYPVCKLAGRYWLGHPVTGDIIYRFETPGINRIDREIRIIDRLSDAKWEFRLVPHRAPGYIRDDTKNNRTVGFAMEYLSPIPKNERTQYMPRIEALVKWMHATPQVAHRNLSWDTVRIGYDTSGNPHLYFVSWAEWENLDENWLMDDVVRRETPLTKDEWKVVLEKDMADLAKMMTPAALNADVENIELPPWNEEVMGGTYADFKAIEGSD